MKTRDINRTFYLEVKVVKWKNADMYFDVLTLLQSQYRRNNRETTVPTRD